MGIEGIDREVKKVKEKSDANNLNKNLKKELNTFKEEGVKPPDKDSKINKDSEIVNSESIIKSPENEVNSYDEPKFCPKCGVNTKPKYKFCKSCGHQLIAFEQIENEVNSYNKPKFCPKCGVNTKSNYKFCKSCGHQLIAFKSDADESEKNYKSHHITNESKTESIPKVFKISTPDINSNKSKEPIKKPAELVKKENINQNINKNISKHIQKENIKDKNVTSNDIKVGNTDSISKDIKVGNTDSIAKNIQEGNINSYSIADEINKFYELKKKGIITSEEFEKKKKQLLDL
ncbi:MAG: zinc ribbon domain-containing protein [Methanobacteriaceae archaeon]|jgi:hypothetical protein|nr:zinc ribbon domain-containing protein [Candidatus Methanorudis spinitermitis]